MTKIAKVETTTTIERVFLPPLAERINELHSEIDALIEKFFAENTRSGSSVVSGPTVLDHLESRRLPMCGSETNR